MGTPNKENKVLVKAESKALTYADSDLHELNRWGKFALGAGLLPNGTNIYQSMAIIQTGHEIGLAPLQSLRSMSFIRGRLVMAVQLQLALARHRGVVLDKIDESDGKCIVTLKRESERITCEYTLTDAKKAGLVRKDGSYEKYGRQMLRWRAIGDALRLIAPDLVMGLLSPEEAENIDPFVSATIVEEKQGDPEFDKLFGVDEKGKTIPPDSPASENGDIVTENEYGDMIAMMKDAGMNPNHLFNHCKKHYNISSLTKIPKKLLPEILDWIKEEGEKKEKEK